MAWGKVGATIGKEIIAWTSTGGKSFLATKPVKINTYGLRFVPKLQDDVFQISKKVKSANKSKEFTYSYLTDTKTLVKKVSEKQPMSLEKISDFVREGLPKYLTEDLSENEFKILLSNITQNSNNDLKLIIKRLNTINKEEHVYFYSLIDDIQPNSGFILDNFSIVNSRIFQNRNFKSLGPDQRSFINIISKDNLQKILDNIDNIEKSDFRKFATKLIYNSKKHNIAFGDEVVKINSSEIISLLSERQSLSYFEEGSATSFNRAINSLTETSHRIMSDDICPYYKVAEGILYQRPELAQIAKDYQEYTSKKGNKEIVSYIKQFFEDLENSGRLPKEIDLKTIVPDENALVSQSNLLDIFIDRLSKN